MLHRSSSCACVWVLLEFEFDGRPGVLFWPRSNGRSSVGIDDDAGFAEDDDDNDDDEEEEEGRVVKCNSPF